MSHKNTVQIIDHTYNENGIFLVNREEEVDVANIHYINVANSVSMNDNYKIIHK